MFTKGRKLVFSKENVISDTPIISETPFCVDLSQNELELKIQSSGNAEWKSTDHLILDIEFSANSRTFIIAEFFTDGQKMIELNYSIIPDHRIKVAFPLCELCSRRWYLTPHPGNLKGHVSGKSTDISKIDSVFLKTHGSREPQSITFYDAYISDVLPDFTVHGEKMVDMFGQNRNAEWEGKIHSEKELSDYLMSEYEKALSDNGYGNPDFDEYGGWKKLKFDTTGYFHIHDDGKRLWLVDPLGYAFISNGVCYGTRMGVHGFIDGMENLFEFLPDKNDEKYKDAWTLASNIPEYVKRNGRDSGNKRSMFNFARANMIRVFGKNWWDAWCVINTARLKRWCFNTISVCVNNYTDERVYDYLKKARMPYTFTLKDFPKTEAMIFRDFPDVFSPEYAKKCDTFAKQLEPLSNDPYMIGYFLNNEPEWLVEKTENIAEKLITSKDALYSKKNFVSFISEKYKTPEAFSVAWEYKISDFSELLLPFPENFPKNGAVLSDLAEMRDILIAAYNGIPRNAVKKYVPNALCLGMRYARITKDDFAGSEYHDSFSFNCYSCDPSELLSVAHNGTDKPFLIGEWHIGASDTNLLCSALVTCENEHTRGRALKRYAEKAFADTHCIGIHYFEYNDQPLLGRFDGEAMPHGLIDVCNIPHEECIREFVKANKRVYQIASGEIPPEDENIKFLPRF